MFRGIEAHVGSSWLGSSCALPTLSTQIFFKKFLMMTLDLILSCQTDDSLVDGHIRPAASLPGSEVPVHWASAWQWLAGIVFRPSSVASFYTWSRLRLDTQSVQVPLVVSVGAKETMAVSADNVRAGLLRLGLHKVITKKWGLS